MSATETQEIVGKLGKLRQGLLNSVKYSGLPQHFESLEQAWCVFPAADCDANWLEHLTGFDA